MAFAELKARQSVMWGNGPYERITNTIRDIHELVIERVDPKPGERRPRRRDRNRRGCDPRREARRRRRRAGPRARAHRHGARASRRGGRRRPVRGRRCRGDVLRRRELRHRDVDVRRHVRARPRRRRERARAGHEAGRTARARLLDARGRAWPDVRDDAPFLPPPPEGAGSPFAWGNGGSRSRAPRRRVRARVRGARLAFALAAGEEYWELFSTSYGPTKTRSRGARRRSPRGVPPDLGRLLRGVSRGRRGRAPPRVPAHARHASLSQRGRASASNVSADARRRHDGQDRLARTPARVRVPVLGDLRRARLVVRLRPLRRPAEGERQGALARGDGARARRHRRARLVDHPPPGRLGGLGPRRRLRRSARRLPLLQAPLPRRPARRGAVRPEAEQASRARPSSATSPSRGSSTSCSPRGSAPVEETGPGRVPAARDRAGHLRQLQERRPDRAPQAAVRHRADRQGVPQRDHARQLHLPHARVRADGDGVLRPARRGAGVVPRTGSSSGVAWHLRYGIRESHLRVRPHDAEELSHYSSATSDIEYLFPIGWSELEGDRAPRRLRPHARTRRRRGRSSSGSTARSATRRTSSSPRSA